MNTSENAPAGTLSIEFTDDLQMVLQQAGGRPVYVGLGEEGMALLGMKWRAAVEAYEAKKATLRKHEKN